MKDRFIWNLSLGVSLAFLPLTGGCLKTVSGSPETVAVAQQPAPEAPDAFQPVPEEDTAAAEPAPKTEISEAAVTPVAAEKTLPANVQPSGPVLQVIDLANSGVEEGTLLAFVTNSTSTFNLRADDIIYLNDIGISGSVVTAMLQRDEVLKHLPANLLPAAPAPAPAQPAPAPDASATYAAAPTPMEGAPPVEYAQEPYPPPPAEDVSSPVFYDDMSPYGNWVDVAGYGLCWQPTVVVLNPGWQPYFDGGRWMYTDCGWYWMSDYSWGWAPFHYGRWFRHHRLGWCWRPDRVWGPSWVCWRYTDAYCGWAPLPPGVHFTHGSGLSGHQRYAGRLSRDSFHFIAWNHFRDHHLGRFAVSSGEVNRFYDRTVLVTRIESSNHRVVNSGISPLRVASVTRTPVRPVALREVNAASANGVRAERLGADGRTLNVFRPVTPQSVAPRTTIVARTRTQVSPSIGSATTFTGVGLTPAPGARSVERTSPTRLPSRLPAPKDDFVPSSGTVAAPTPPGAGQSVAGSGTVSPSRPATSAVVPANRAQRPASTVVRIPANNTRSASSFANRSVSQPQSSAENPASGVADTQTRSSQRSPVVIHSSGRSSRALPSQPATPVQSAPPGVNVIQTPQPSATPAQPAWSASRNNADWSGRTERQQPATRMETPRSSPAVENRFTARPDPPARTAPAEAPRYTPAPVERSRSDSAPSRASQPSYSAPERSSRSEVRESSRSSAPAPSPPPSSSRSDSSSSRSDRSSRR